MARTLEQLLEQEKPEVVAEARRKASEMLRILDEQTTAKQDYEADLVDYPPRNNKGPDKLALCYYRARILIQQDSSAIQM